MPVIIVGLVLGGGVAWRYLFSEAARARRALRAVPLLAVAEAPDGKLVKLSGTLRYAEHPVLMAPLSERGCALYRVVVQEHKSGGRSAHPRTIIDTSECQRSFWLEDHSGRALIKPVLTRVTLVNDARYRSGILKQPTAALDAFLLEHGQDPSGLVFNRNLEYLEGVLVEGEQVVVLGLARHEPDPDPQSAADYRERATRLVVTDPPDGPMLLSDEPLLTRGAPAAGKDRAGR